MINNQNRYIPALITLSLCISSPGVSYSKESPEENELAYLKSLPIEDLLQTEITSVSKKPEKLVDAAAAVFVITAEDIRRTGVRSIPEALRMVPGLQVANISANKWAISARGFTDLFSNKLLVLIDGRSVYTPLYSGVFWEIQDTILEDIERIEVIRGPGATLWGANAVNGVINIITKPSSQTQGALLSGGFGTKEPFDISARVGGKIKEKGHFRIYAKAKEHDGFVMEDGEDANDAQESLRTGFRSDLDIDDKSTLTFQGEVVKGEEELTYRFPGILSPEESGDDIDYKEANLLGRWEKKESDGSSMSLQAYYSYSKIEAQVPKENRNTFDLDFQHKTNYFQGNEIIWGLGYRISRDDIEPNNLVQFDPEERTEELFSSFIQDEITLIDDSLWLTLGSKFEHNDYSGFEVQPNIRTRWKPTETQSVWAAVSRSVRSPSRADHDIIASSRAGVDPVTNLPWENRIYGNDDFDSEELLAYEAGHRWAPNNRISFDTALFYNEYENLRSLDFGTPFVEFQTTGPKVILPIEIGNNLSAETYGIELLVSWQPVTWWKLMFGYSYLHLSFDGESDTNWDIQEFNEGDSPQHQLQFRSYIDFCNNWTFDTEIYYVDELEARDIDSYVRLDLRIGWEIAKGIEVSLIGENLLDSEHSEFGSSNSVVGSEVPRQFFAKLTWNY